MAAHGLTLMRHCAQALQSGDATRIALVFTNALAAVGTSTANGFDFDCWSKIDREFDRCRTFNSRNKARLRRLVDAAVVQHHWMNEYPTLEALSLAQARYVKPGTPYYNRRHEAFDKGDAACHSKARALIVAEYPLDRKAPQNSSS